MQKVYELLPIEMTEEEKVVLGQDIADLEIEIEQIEADKKRDNDHYNSMIKDKAANVLVLSKRLKQGTKDAEVECYWLQDDPRPGMKTLYRFDSGEKVRIEEMSLFDEQTELPLDDVEEAQIIAEDHQLTSGDILPENIEETEGEAA